ncbi:MAG: peptidoglycan-binding protein, partial [Clostridia bacterium]|nr:peptidoglycan-binding protein [Clostridia bacterium]
TVATKYVQTIMDDVYLRAAASKDSEHPYQVKLGTVMAYNTSVSVGGQLWYRVIYSNSEVWVLGECVKVMTTAEYEAYLASNPSSTPQTQIILGYVKTTESSVNVRVGAGSSSKLGQIDKGIVMPYSATATAKGYTWYYANTSLGQGYLREDVVTICDKDGNAVTSGGSTSGSTNGQEATYTTLKLGSKGTAVKNLVTELKLQGYYSGAITSSYTTAVQSAVKAFQSANGLEVDGIAGSQTQHKLYGTVPVGSGDSSNLSFTIYPAEKIDWYTGGIQQLWAKGSSYKVYDVKTGIVWWARRWSGAYHADVEPLTAADSARLCQIYGTKTTQQIWDDNLWHRRPCLVTIGSRTFACSLFGMPHNYPDGDTIPDNDMKGQICIHFKNSKIHDSSVVDEDHQKAIEQAYQYAKNGDPR